MGKSCPSATLPIANPARTALESKSDILSLIRVSSPLRVCGHQTDAGLRRSSPVQSQRILTQHVHRQCRIFISWFCRDFENWAGEGRGVVLEHASVYSGWLVHWTIGSKATFVWRLLLHSGKIETSLATTGRAATGKPGIKQKGQFALNEAQHRRQMAASIGLTLRQYDTTCGFLSIQIQEC